MPTVLRCGAALMLGVLLMIPSPAASEPASYEYDEADRLTVEFVGNVRIAYEYDVNGNLLGRTSCIADCFFDESCFVAGDANPDDACQVCDPTTDRFAWTRDPDAPGCGANEDMGLSGDPDMGGDPERDDAGTGSGPDAGSENPDAGGNGGGGSGTEDDNDGCGCGVGAGSRDASLLFVLVALVFARRRRRRRKTAAAGGASRVVVMGGILAVLALLPVTAFAQITVCKDGSCQYTSIAEGISNSQAGATIVVKPDVYDETNLILRGGRTLTSTSPESPDVIIDGGGQARVFMTMSNATLRGATVRNGLAPAGSTGGGVHLSGGGRVVMQNVVFENNESSEAGGAIANNTGFTTLIISNAVFRDNSAEGGGAIVGTFDLLRLHDVLFEDNTASTNFGTGAGGAVAVSGTALKITNCQFEGNTAYGPNAGRGGAISSTMQFPMVKDSTFSGNVAFDGANAGSGGAIYAAGNWVFENVDLTGNTATEGGAVFLSGSGEFRGGSVTQNTARAPDGIGGGIRCSGGIGLVGMTADLSNNTPDDADTCIQCTAGDTQNCTTDLPGPCAPGTQTCGAGGFWETCEPNVMPAEAETMCMDGIDEDCDGATDMDDYECKPVWPPTRAQVAGPGGERGDPVSTFTGEFFTRLDPDLTVPGPRPLVFRRYYASALEAHGLSGSLGTNWRHSLEWSLVESGNITVTAWDGRQIEFESVSNGVWDLVGTSDVQFRLTPELDGYVLYDPRDGLRRAFNTGGQLVRIWDGTMNSLFLSYTSGDLTEVRDELGRTLQFTYTNGMLDSVTDGARTVSYTRVGSELTMVTDVFGNDTQYTYTGGGLLTSITRPVGNTPLTHTWLGDGRLGTQTDADGNATTFTYDDVAGTCTIADALGHDEVHAHNLAGQLLEVRRASGETTKMSYGRNGRRTDITDGSGGSVERTYDAASEHKTESTLADGRTISYDLVDRFDGQDFRKDVGAIHYPDGTSEQFAYNSTGKLVEHVDRAGHTTAYSYDEFDRVVSTTNVAGAMASYTYDTTGMLATVTDHHGNTTTYAYDANFHPASVTHADGSSRTTTYDAAGRMTSVTDENGNTSTYVHDANGNLTSIISRDGGTTTFGYDDQDRLVSVTDPEGGVSSLTYDERGQIASTTDENGAIVSFEYDEDGRRDAVVDAGGERWTRMYDARGMIVTLTNPLGETTTFDRNAAGDVTAVTTPSGAVATVTYDEMGRIASETDFAGGVTTYSYDERGDVVGIEAPGGVFSSYDRNELGLTTVATDPAGDEWDFGYDGLGLLTGWSDPDGNTVSVEYDARLRASSYTLPGGLGTVSLTYDGLGNIVSQVYSDGTTLTRTYDERGRLMTADDIAFVRDGNGDIVQSDSIAMGRDPLGRLVTVSYPPGDVTYLYDTADNLVEVTDWLGNTTTFGYDAAGRRTSVTRPSGAETTVSYDTDGVIVGVVETAGAAPISTIVLERDAAGKTIGATRDLPALPSLPDDVSLSAGTGGKLGGATYDALGRLTGDGTRSYTWDAASRLASHDDGTGEVTYTHNGLLQVRTRTEGGTTTEYVWNHGTTHPSIPIIRTDGNDAAYYVFTPGGGLLYRVDAATDEVRHYHYDEMGNTLFLTDENGDVSDTYAYTAFGVLTDATGSTDNPFTYSGRYGVIQDGDSGLYVMGRRFYDSMSQRFISPEPVRDFSHPRLMNLYAYALGNPLMFVDPTGETNDADRKNQKAIVSGAGTVHKVVSAAAADTVNGATAVMAVAPNLDLSAEAVETLSTIKKDAEAIADGLGNAGHAIKAADLVLTAQEEGGLAVVEKIAPDLVEAGTAKLVEKVTKGDLGDKVAKKLGKGLGGAAKKVFGVGYEAAKMRQQVKEKMDDLRDGLRSDLANYYLVTDLIWESYRKKLIDFDELERRLVEAKETFEMSREATSKSGTTNVKIELLRGLQKMLESTI